MDVHLVLRHHSGKHLLLPFYGIWVLPRGKLVSVIGSALEASLIERAFKHGSQFMDGYLNINNILGSQPGNRSRTNMVYAQGQIPKNFAQFFPTGQPFSWLDLPDPIP